MDLDEKVLYKGWLPVEDEMDDTDEEAARLHIEAIDALKIVVQATPPRALITGLLAQILASLHAMATAQQSAHWRSLGESFYGDHLMYQRMYEGTIKEIDQVAEKMMGMSGDETALDPSRLLMTACIAAKSLITPGDLAGTLLQAENRFLTALASSISALGPAMTPGLENMLQGIADRHEEHVYLLSRRVGVRAV